MPKHVGVDTLMNCILWFVVCCILLSALVGCYTEYFYISSSDCDRHPQRTNVLLDF